MVICYVLVLDHFSFYSCLFLIIVFLMIRRPPRSTHGRSSAASDVYKRQVPQVPLAIVILAPVLAVRLPVVAALPVRMGDALPVSYTHLRAHETVLDLVCRLLLEKKNYYLPLHIHSHNMHLPSLYHFIPHTLHFYTQSLHQHPLHYK